ncbi:hypothetical protein [Candidatus Poriferisodalis sp.]
MKSTLFAPVRFLLRRRRLPAGIPGALTIVIGGFAAISLLLLLFT